jgi:hypothetical protein
MHNADRGSRLRRFFAELSRRKLIGAMTAYAIGAWAFVQVASVILPAFEAPSWTLATIIAAFVGAPFALLAAWTFNLTPGGLVRTEALVPEPPLPDPESVPVIDNPAAVDVQTAAGTGPERRQVTLLLAGIAIRGPNAEEIDPEVEREAAPAVRHACEDIARALDAYIGTANNDLAVYFGVPTAHETMPWAVRAGLGMLRAVASRTPPSGARRCASTARIRAPTGTVVADDGGADGPADPSRCRGMR